MKLNLTQRNLSSGESFGPREPLLEKSERYQGIANAGIVPVKTMLLRLGFDTKINEKLNLLKVRRGYAESDHILALALNPLNGGQTIDDVERMRRDEPLRKALAANSISDPTTLGDFCRRFDGDDVNALQDAVNEVRVEAWKTQPSSFFQRATIDADGVFTPTGSECSEGVEYLAPKQDWGYHPLIVSFAETQEPIYIVNRRGARPSHELAHEYFDKSIDLFKSAGFQEVVLRGDTAFTQTIYLDAWDDMEGVGFVFGMAACKPLVNLADGLEEAAWSPLIRPVREVDEDEERARQPRHKQLEVEKKEYTDLRLEKEDVTEVEYSPSLCQKTYRLIILRKTIQVWRGTEMLFPETRYFFYISNLKEHTPRDIVREANERCNQENLNAHLKSGVGALRAPLKTLNSNWAYMVITALAWSFKAWFALVGEFDSPTVSTERAIQRRLLTMEFRTFVNELMAIPALVIESGRQIIVKLLSDPPWARHLLAAHSSLRE